MPCEYAKDEKDELHLMAKPLIEQYHTTLKDANILFLFRVTEKKYKKTIVQGEAKKAGDVIKYLTGADFIISVHSYGWHTYLTPEKRVALMDHLLSHCRQADDKEGMLRFDKFGDPVWECVKPEANFFLEVIRRHGPWNDAAEAIFQTVIEQEQASVT